MRLLVVKADTDDGDCIEKTTILSKNFDYKNLSRIAKIVNENYGDWKVGDLCQSGEEPEEVYKDKLTQEDIDWFCDFLPNGTHGIHTIESVVAYEISKKRKFL